MRDPYDIVEGNIVGETPKAICLNNALWSCEPVEHQIGGDFWIPKANIHEESSDTIDEALRGDKIEIHVARWWLKQEV